MFQYPAFAPLDEGKHSALRSGKKSQNISYAFFPSTPIFSMLGCSLQNVLISFGFPSEINLSLLVRLPLSVNLSPDSKTSQSATLANFKIFLHLLYLKETLQHRYTPQRISKSSCLYPHSKILFQAIFCLKFIHQIYKVHVVAKQSAFL